MVIDVDSGARRRIWFFVTRQSYYESSISQNPQDVFELISDGFVANGTSREMKNRDEWGLGLGRLDNSD
jgi:hypothetical protein